MRRRVEVLPDPGTERHRLVALQLVMVALMAGYLLRSVEQVVGDYRLVWMAAGVLTVTLLAERLERRIDVTVTAAVEQAVVRRLEGAG